MLFFAFPCHEKSVMGESIIRESIIRESVIRESVIGESVIGESVVEQSVLKEFSMESLYHEDQNTRVKPGLRYLSSSFPILHGFYIGDLLHFTHGR